MYKKFCSSPPALSLPPQPAVQPPLHRAILSGEPAGTGADLLKLADLQITDSNGTSALHIAVEKANVSWLKYLLKNNVSINAVDKWGITPLMLAAKHKLPSIMEILVPAGADVNIANLRRQTVLHFAVGSGCERCVQIVLTQKPKINVQDDDGVTPLLLAAVLSMENVIEMLLNHKGVVKPNPNLTDSNGRTPLHWTAEVGTVRTVRALVAAKADLNAKDIEMDTPFVRAIKANNVGVCEELIKAGCDRNDIDGLNGTAMTMASILGRTQIIQCLIEAGEDVDELGHNGLTPLSAAAFESHVDVVKLLLKHGANPNIANRSGSSALMKAVFCTRSSNEEARHEIVAALLNANADPNFRVSKAGLFTPVTNGRNCALSLAIMSGYPSLARMIVIAGAVVSCCEFKEWISINDELKWFETKEMLYPLCIYVTTAKPLKHLCRQQIRKCVGQNLTEKLELLKLPSQIVDYLCYGEFNQMPIQRAELLKKIEFTEFDLSNYNPCSGLRGLQGTLTYDIIHQLT